MCSSRLALLCLLRVTAHYENRQLFWERLASPRCGFESRFRCVCEYALLRLHSRMYILALFAFAIDVKLSVTRVHVSTHVRAHVHALPLAPVAFDAQQLRNARSTEPLLLPLLHTLLRGLEPSLYCYSQALPSRARPLRPTRIHHGIRLCLRRRYFCSSLSFCNICHTCISKRMRVCVIICRHAVIFRNGQRAHSSFR